MLFPYLQKPLELGPIFYLIYYGISILNKETKQRMRGAYFLSTLGMALLATDNVSSSESSINGISMEINDRG